MQDTILTLSKDSVRQFVAFMMKYIPIETNIESTAKVTNKFLKPAELEEEIQDLEDEMPESEMDEVQRVRKELD